MAFIFYSYCILYMLDVYAKLKLTVLGFVSVKNHFWFYCGLF